MTATTTKNGKKRDEDRLSTEWERVLANYNATNKMTEMISEKAKKKTWK